MLGNSEESTPEPTGAGAGLGWGWEEGKLGGGTGRLSPPDRPGGPPGEDKSHRGSVFDRSESEMGPALPHPVSCNMQHPPAVC